MYKNLIMIATLVTGLNAQSMQQQAIVAQLNKTHQALLQTQQLPLTVARRIGTIAGHFAMRTVLAPNVQLSAASRVRAPRYTKCMMLRYDGTW